MRDAVREHQAGVAELSEVDLRPVVIKDFQVDAAPPGKRCST